MLFIDVPVALNFQTTDVPLSLNDGWFRRNGNCGYLLKPPSVLGTGSLPNKPIPLSIVVLSASCLPKPDGEDLGEVIDPYVSVTVHDVEQAEGIGYKEVCHSFTTKVVEDNGFYPVWNETFCCEIHNPDVAIISFQVDEKDVGKKDDKVAQSSIPFSCLRKGVRSVPLYDMHNTRHGPFSCATLLVNVKY